MKRTGNHWSRIPIGANAVFLLLLIWLWVFGARGPERLAYANPDLVRLSTACRGYHTLATQEHPAPLEQDDANENAPLFKEYCSALLPCQNGRPEHEPVAAGSYLLVRFGGGNVHVAVVEVEDPIETTSRSGKPIKGQYVTWRHEVALWPQVNAPICGVLLLLSLLLRRRQRVNARPGAADDSPANAKLEA